MTEDNHAMIDVHVRRWLAMSALGGLLALAAAAQPARAADPLNLNVILSLTGPGSFLGKNEQTALAVLEQTVNKGGGIDGRPVHFIIADDQSSPQVDVQLASALIASGTPIIMGPSLTGGCNAITALLKADGPLLYCLTAGAHPAKGSFAFTYGVSTGDLIAANVRYFHERGWKKIALITSTDASGQDGENGLDTALKRPEFADMTVVAREHYAVADQTVTAQITRIKASGAQALLAWGTGSPIGTVFRSISDVGLDIPVAVSASNLIYPQMKAFASFLPPQFMSAGLPAVALDSIPPGPLHTAVREFTEDMKAAGFHGDVALSIGWDPALIVINAYKKLGPNATAAQLRAYLSDLHGFAGANGVYDFRDGSQRGLTEANAIMVRWDAGRDTWVAISKFGGEPLK
jgi:branched-chain amino acid transport system substrate-binding protein